MIGKIIYFDELVKVQYQCKSVIQFNGKFEQAKFEKKQGKTLAETNQIDSCMLQILDHTKKRQGNGQSQFDVIYNCQQPFKSLEQILEQELKVQDKMNYFYKLMKLAINLKNQKITHFNIKPSNVILYNDRFYLIDFGYLKDKPADLIIGINYIQYKEHDDEQKRNLYPYLNDEFLTYIKEYNDGIKEKLQKISKGSIQNNDRYALGVMMFELFVPLKNIYINFEIDTCAKNRKMQLEKIYDCQEKYGKIVIEQIKNIIQDILLKYELPSNNTILELKQKFKEYQNSLQPKNNLLNQQNLNLSLSYAQDSDTESLIKNKDIRLSEKMRSEHQDYIQSLRSDNTLQFDPNLLYYLDEKDLKDYYGKIKNSQLEELKKKAWQILSCCRQTYQKKLYQEDFSKLEQEDKYYILKNILTDYKKFEYKIQDEIESLNSIDQTEFKFNQINRELTYKKEQIQQIEQTQEIVLKQKQEFTYEIQITQKTEQTDKHFEQMLQNAIPNILRFLEYQFILKKKQDNQELKYEFEQMREQNIGFYSAKLKNQNQFWTIFEKKDNYNKLFIGKNKFGSSEEYEGRIIEETKYQILDYQNVKYNLEKDKNFGEEVTIYIYNISKFELITFYQGGLQANKYHGKGLIKDWINNYEYDGSWKQGKKDGEKGKLKILNKELLQKNEFSELVVDYSDDYLKKGKTLGSEDYQNKSFEIDFSFDNALKIHKQEDECNGKHDCKHFIKSGCSKLCKIFGSKLVDCLHSIKNSLINCKKPR